MPVFRSPSGSRGCPNRIGSPAQDYDQLQCLRIFPLPGIPTATDGNSPHTRVCLTPQNDETKSYSGKTRSYWSQSWRSRSRLPTTISWPEKCPFRFFPAGDRLPGRTVVPEHGNKACFGALFFSVSGRNTKKIFLLQRVAEIFLRF